MRLRLELTSTRIDPLAPGFAVLRVVMHNPGPEPVSFPETYYGGRVVVNAQGFRHDHSLHLVQRAGRVAWSPVPPGDERSIPVASLAELFELPDSKTGKVWRFEPRFSWTWWLGTLPPRSPIHRYLHPDDYEEEVSLWASFQPRSGGERVLSPRVRLQIASPDP